MNAVVELLNFFEGHEVCAELEELTKSIGESNVRIVVMHFFDWLRYKSIFGRQKPLRLNPQYPWCVNLTNLIENFGDLGDLFVADSVHCDFRDCVVEQQRDQIRELVRMRYRPVAKL